MSSVILTPRTLKDPRLAAVMERLRISRAEALGVVALFLLTTRQAGLESLPEDDALPATLPFVANRTSEAVLEALQAARYVVLADGGLSIPDNAGIGAGALKRKEAASRAGKASAAKRAKKGRRKAPQKADTQAMAASSVVEPPIGAQAWDAYALAYERRYHAPPVSNATTRGQMAAIIKRIGPRALEVMPFYVAHNDSFYVQKQHPVGLALKDCESLVTQYATQRPVTSQDVRGAEKQYSYNKQLEDIRAGKFL